MKAIYTIASLGLCVSCGGENGGTSNENEVITTVILTFAPPAGPAVVATFDDPDGDGGQAPVVDPVSLTAGSYTLTVQFQSRLVVPAEEITDEVRDEQDFHLLLFTGTGVTGPATTNTVGPIAQTYADADHNGLPIGLTNHIVATPGMGQLTVTLRHLPPEQPPVKSPTTVMDAKTTGIESLGGNTDAQVSFPVDVR